MPSAACTCSPYAGTSRLVYPEPITMCGRDLDKALDRRDHRVALLGVDEVPGRAVHDQQNPRRWQVVAQREQLGGAVANLVANFDMVKARDTASSNAMPVRALKHFSVAGALGIFLTAWITSSASPAAVCS